MGTDGSHGATTTVVGTAAATTERVPIAPEGRAAARAVLAEAAERFSFSEPTLASSLIKIGMSMDQLAVADPVCGDDVVALVVAIRRIVGTWERGDLAGAVNVAEEIAGDVTARLPEAWVERIADDLQEDDDGDGEVLSQAATRTKAESVGPGGA